MRYATLKGFFFAFVKIFKTLLTFLVAVVAVVKGIPVARQNQKTITKLYQRDPPRSWLGIVVIGTTLVLSHTYTAMEA